MGTVYRKTVTKPLPPKAEVFERQGKRHARWKDGKGKARSAPLTIGNAGTERIVIKARTYTAKYRDGSGIVREVATGCRDEAAARSILADLERRAELVKGKVLSADEDAMIDHQNVPVAEHLAAYLIHLQAKGDSEVHLGDTRRLTSRVITDCRFVDLGDISHDTMERWLVQRSAEGMGSRTRNSYLQAIRGFCNWCIQTNRMVVNPLRKIAKADERVDRRRNRRALTEDELVRLLDAACRRPLAECGRLTAHKPKEQMKRCRDTWTRLPLCLEDIDAAVQRARERLARSPQVIARLEALGRERALIYKTLVLTGLRQGELASLTTGQLVLDADPPFLVLHAADEKNREGSTIPLRADLGADLRTWVSQKVGVVVNTRLFAVPTGLVRILEYDLRLAGIPKVDERGRSVDVHALRHTFGTLLSKAGVAPRTAQAAMRHSKIDLTMNVYTDPKLLDVAGAIETLPALPLGAIGQKPADVKAIGTDISSPSRFAPAFAPTAYKSSTLQSFSDTKASDAREKPGNGGIAVSAYPVKQNDPPTMAVSGSLKEAPIRVELMMADLQFLDLVAFRSSRIHFSGATGPLLS